jgi:hypothetical protein
MGKAGKNDFDYDDVNYRQPFFKKFSGFEISGNMDEHGYSRYSIK